MKKDYQKALKKLTSFFLFMPNLLIYIFSFETSNYYRQSYQKQKGPGTSDLSLYRLQNKFRIIPLLVTYYLTKFDDVI